MKQYDSVAVAVAAVFGADVSVTDGTAGASGGINDVRVLRLSDGQSLFLKTRRHESAAFFEAEADGVAALAATGAVRTPEIYAIGRDEAADTAFLIMRHIERACPQKDYWERLGRELAAMHRADTSTFVPGGKFGFAADNYIGATPQLNTPAESWVAFFRDARLAPQFRLAADTLTDADKDRAAFLLDHLDRYLAEPAYPSLLHGDLWHGNVMPDESGAPMLIDPAVYVGDREADLAMTELFGGFPEAFYGAYREVAPLDTGYDARRDLYNLYHLTNHLNLFGRMYYSAVAGLLKRFAG